MALPDTGEGAVPVGPPRSNVVPFPRRDGWPSPFPSPQAWDPYDRRQYVTAWGMITLVLAVMAGARATRGLAVALALSAAFYTALIVSGWRSVP